MKLHVFNPEHDLALAANLSNFTAPHAGRQLRADLGYIPALWAKADDLVLVENVDDAERRFRRLVRKPFRRFISKESLAHQNITAVDVWGWDPAICAFLRRQGISEQVLPSASNLATIRELSHRNFARQLLLKLQGSGIVGEASIANSLEQVETLLAEHKKVVVKAPWSSSGRGVRFISDTINIPDKGWIRNVISSQGSVMVEPYYNKVRDFGMEFESDGQGKVSYLGLSLFHTVGGSYMGNILAD